MTRRTIEDMNLERVEFALAKVFREKPSRQKYCYPDMIPRARSRRAYFEARDAVYNMTLRQHAAFIRDRAALHLTEKNIRSAMRSLIDDYVFDQETYSAEPMGPYKPMPEAFRRVQSWGQEAIDTKNHALAHLVVHYGTALRSEATSFALYCQASMIIDARQNAFELMAAGNLKGAARVRLDARGWFEGANGKQTRITYHAPGQKSRGLYELETLARTGNRGGLKDGLDRCLVLPPPEEIDFRTYVQFEMTSHYMTEAYNVKPEHVISALIQWRTERDGYSDSWAREWMETGLAASGDNRWSSWVVWIDSLDWPPAGTALADEFPPSMAEKAFVP
jgi:hypothetical protein